MKKLILFLIISLWSPFVLAAESFISFVADQNFNWYYFKLPIHILCFQHKTHHGIYIGVLGRTSIKRRVPKDLTQIKCRFYYNLDGEEIPQTQNNFHWPLQITEGEIRFTVNNNAPSRQVLDLTLT